MVKSIRKELMSQNKDRLVEGLLAFICIMMEAISVVLAPKHTLRLWKTAFEIHRLNGGSLLETINDLRPLPPSRHDSWNARLGASMMGGTVHDDVPLTEQDSSRFM